MGGGGDRGLGKTWVVRGGYSRPALKVDRVRWPKVYLGNSDGGD
jgi:hypothetical protein